MCSCFVLDNIPGWRLSSSAAGDAICPAMCGRVHLSSDVEKLIQVFSIPPPRPAPNIAASWNVAPTDPLPVVRYSGSTRERGLDVRLKG